MQMTSVSTAVVLMYAAPMYVMLYSVSFFGERFSRTKLVAVFCMLLGCCLVSGIVGGLEFDALGILIGALSGIAYAAYNILTKISMRRGNSPVSTTLYGFLVMSVLAASVCHPGEMVACVAASPGKTLVLLVGLGIVTFVLPYVLYTLAMREMPAGTVSALSIVEPLSATVFGIVLFDEPLDWFSGIGIVLIFAAVLLLARGESDARGKEGLSK
jgi:drug/metabolite transporter (DMT)-like permease